jgi:hypothetical protein
LDLPVPGASMEARFILPDSIVRLEKSRAASASQQCGHDVRSLSASLSKFGVF